MQFVVLIIAAYLAGSIPFGLLISKAHGKDLRQIGSGNIGATNLARVLGRKWAYFCFALDVSKGLVPTVIAAHFLSTPLQTPQLALWLAVGCAAVIGHILPVYIGFKGGKGVATSFGVALGLWPYFTLCSLVSFAIWAFVALAARYVSLASIIAALAFPVTMTVAIFIVPAWQFARLWPLLVVAVAIPLMVILRHRQNIRRLISGNESKIRGT